MKNYDVVVIGAGIIGLSIALQLVRRSSLQVLVLEKAPRVGEGSTGASSAVCRHRYSRTEMVHLARDGINAYRHWAQFTGLNEPRAEFHAHGVLWMPGEDCDWSRREHARMSDLGIATLLLDDEELARRFPVLSTCTRVVDTVTGHEHDCHGGGEHLFELEGGYIDPGAALDDLVEACCARNIDVMLNTQVSEVTTKGGRVEGVKLADGSVIEAPYVINAAGPWCNSIFRSLELDLLWTLVPTRIQVLYLDLPTDWAEKIPVSVDMTNGIYFRLQNRGQQLVVGSVLEQDEREEVANPDEFNRFADDSFIQAKLHALHHRFPTLPYRGAVRSYSGLYTVNHQDVHPIVGETEVPGFIAANGLSGHGFKLAPAIGSQVAQWLTGVTTDFDTQVPIDFFSLQRQPIDPDSKSVLA